MTVVRRATPADAEELVRLRKIMLDAMRPSDDVEWQPHAAKTLRSHLADGGGPLAVFVVDAPDVPGTLAACATGTINLSLGSPGNPEGTSGHVFNVCTDPAYRRRGYSRACMEALLAWFEEREVRRVDLHASTEGEPLYSSLGFARTPAPAMRLTL
ncbi:MULTISPECIES: GNAT family N-acetyltransferase [unclassified Streptomyces]|uniref:GNAT family N-acetyltransferase n=1 Tax=unclassified Streptomyces TaxID=2593676 RepID=UPI00278C6C4D|nr:MULTISPECIES: GNAT family N-acetyltransferase [unclassified Streptomyces]